MKLNWRSIRSPYTWILFFSLTLSITALVIYLIGVNLNDDFLFFLLSVCKYSAVIALLSAVYKLFRNIVYLIYRPTFYRLFKILGFIIIILYCAGIFYFEAFITVIAGGNE